VPAVSMLMIYMAPKVLTVNVSTVHG